MLSLAYLSRAAGVIAFAAASGGLLPLATASGGRSARQGTAPAAPDPTTLGPQVGQKVPDFTLPDQAGRPRTLSSLMGKAGLVLVFNRSADW